MGEQSNSKHMLGIWRFFTSMRFGLVLMFLLAGAAMLGVLLPQELAAQSGTLLNIFKFVGLDNVFSTWWFHALALLLVFNVLACLLNRVGAVLSVLRFPRMTVGAIDRLKSYQSFPVKDKCEEVQDKFIQVLLANRYHVLQGEEEEQVQLYADKHRLELLGSLLLHIGILVLAAGLTWVSLTSYEGTITVPVGAAFKLSDMQNTTGTPDHNFTVQVNSAEQHITSAGLYDYWPNLSIVDNGSVVKSGAIGYNSPLSYQGVNLYLVQFTHGVLVTINGQPEVIMPNRPNYFALTASNDLYVAFTNIHPDPNRPTVDYMIIQPSSPQPVAQGVLHAGEGQSYQNQFSFSLVGYRASIGLRAVKQPGLGSVLGGAVILLAGMLLTLFLRYRKIWITIMPDGEQVQVTVGGYSAKQRLRFAAEFNSLVEEARALVGGVEWRY